MNRRLYPLAPRALVFLAIFAGYSLVAPARPARCQEFKIDWAMDADPKLETPRPRRVFPEQLIPLWSQALSRPENELRRLTALTIVQARRLEMPGLDALVSPLADSLVSPDSTDDARFAAALALIALDSREHAADLAERSLKGNLALAQIVEPALAKWDYLPERETWLARLGDAKASKGAKLLAIRGLAIVAEPRAAAPLENLAFDRKTPTAIRLEAASALAKISRDGLEEKAVAIILAAKSPPVERLVAARVLAGHSSEATIDLLAKWSEDSEPAVAAIALARIVEIAPERAISLADRVQKHSDAKLRGLALSAFASRPAPEHISRIAAILKDADPEIRSRAARTLLEWAATEALSAPIRETVLATLVGGDWRELEQAAWLAGQLDFKPAAERLVPLLNHSRVEVYVTAAWALRRLAVPETMAPCLALAGKRTQGRSRASPSGIDEQIALLFELFGQMKYSPAESLLMSYVPLSDQYGAYSRPAAIWALGKLHEGAPTADLTAQLIARIEDRQSQFPPVETMDVKRMAAVTLARTNAVESLPKLRDSLVIDSKITPLVVACRWAIGRLTGEELPPLELEPIEEKDWFLAPLD